MSHSDAAVMDPAVTEAEVAEPVQARKPKPKQPTPKRQPRYHVILWDDPNHTYDYVIEMMCDLFRVTIEKAYVIAKEVDTQGRAICLTTTKEHAELKRDQIRAFGKDFRSRSSTGSMAASIEPAR
jgi:ATP-dependent Clp protease adaptor protein ClpS